MKKVIAFAGSNSKASINKQLATYTANKLEDITVKILDLNDYNLPLYGIDLENDQGIPKDAHSFLKEIKSSDGVIISLAEHNGAYTTAFKNTMDWLSRIENNFWDNKPMLLMATSPGKRGGQSVLTIANDRFPRHGAKIIETFSLPSFYENFSSEGIKDQNLNTELENTLTNFKNNM